jgi:hypothetical protein
VQKTFSVFINRDSYVENADAFTVNLVNPAGGAILGTPFSSTVTISDSNSGLPPNAIDDAGIFVRMHYHDFLNREPDQSGLDFWTAQITSCGIDVACTEVKRINVSAAFFMSIEFQQTGFLVERFIKSDMAMPSGGRVGCHTLAVPSVRFNHFSRTPSESAEAWSSSLQGGNRLWKTTSAPLRWSSCRHHSSSTHTH